MCGKKLCKNLKYYLEPLVNTTVYLFDHHIDRELPCIYVGYDTEEGSFSSPRGHYTVSGYVSVLYQGYADLTNENADYTSQQVLSALDADDCLTTLNKPLSGTDVRPEHDIRVNALIIRRVSRMDEDHSTTISVEFDAFCAAKDF